MGMKDYVKNKYGEYKKKHNEEVAYNKIVETRATQARRQAYADEYKKASAASARAKARADVSGTGKSGGIFSEFVKNNSNSFSGFGLPSGGSVMGSNPMFSGNQAPRQQASYRKQTSYKKIGKGKYKKVVSRQRIIHRIPQGNAFGLQSDTMNWGV